MKRIETSCEINASIDKVWQVLMNFAEYARWNPFIVLIEGEQRVGEKLNVKIIPAGKKPMVFKPIITVLKENTVLQWRGKFLLPGLFDGIHSFELKPLTQNKTLFYQHEKFSGALVPLVYNSLKSATEAGFQAMNQALKQRCEL